MVISCVLPAFLERKKYIRRTHRTENQGVQSDGRNEEYNIRREQFFKIHILTTNKFIVFKTFDESSVMLKTYLQLINHI